ncbi:phosphatidate cytidylyltransferase [Williamsoniiplasma lucivorax]|uniref:Phosphatidate cytidylyltransferase n=1 Tax=Williamsoniiplasma lucivorax TaxID=209274 RepID=A0A2S5RDT6_9MOLU|nr:phosphatidate cytidylyltransferase [Williamsoniiplasma lucivorax]PPE05467.1 phosphatidate cytidylyltransferase [Williamsoniiplasma lucivorax]
MSENKNLQTKLDKQKNNNLKIRTLSAMIMLCFLAVYLLLVVFSTEAQRQGWKIDPRITSYVFYGCTMVLLVISIHELANSLGYKKIWMQILIVILPLAIFYFPFFKANNLSIIDVDAQIHLWFDWWFTLIMVSCYFLLLLALSFASKEEHAKRKMIVLFAYSLIIIIGFKGLSEIALTMNTIGNHLDHNPKYGFMTIIWVWGTVILTDTFAYLGGTKFGKTPLAPTISPKKSCEGALIGTVGATLIGALVANLSFYLVPNFGPLSWNLGTVQATMPKVIPGLLLTLLTLLISILGQLGDLLFSGLKRMVGIKDFANCFPGHGGVLDRFDSLIFVTFFLFIIIQII